MNIKTILLLIIFSVNFSISFAQDKFTQTGIASYYSDIFHGKKTSSGEKYDKTLYTAAHSSLPFQTYVKITNLKNNLSVVVKINDRCPKYHKRIIDLSKAAAQKIDIIQSGIANVKLEVISKEEKDKIEIAVDSLNKKIKGDTSAVRKK